MTCPTDDQLDNKHYYYYYDKHKHSWRLYCRIFPIYIILLIFTDSFIAH